YIRLLPTQRLVCSQSLFVAGLLPFLFERMANVDKKVKTMALNGPLIGIIGAGGQLGSALTQTFLENGWDPFRLAVCGRGDKKLKAFEAQGVGVFDDVAVLVQAVKLVVVAVGPQHARQVGSMLGGAGMASRLVLSTLAGISEASLTRVLGTHHLLQTRVDMAGLEMAQMVRNFISDGKGSPPVPPTSAYCGPAMDGNQADTSCAASSSIRHSHERLWQAVHERAARHFFHNARASDRMFCTLQSFFEGQGLEEIQAFQACRDWLRLGPSSKPYTSQQEDEVSTPTESYTRSPTHHPPDPAALCKRDGDIGGGGWTPTDRIKWPPSDLVRIKSINSEV
ncbi:unnamed protein product, partial [Hapterophycus canaliculatus]